MNDLERQNLASEWRHLMLRLSLPPAQDLFQHLVSAYTAPTRHYHNLHHLAACLSELHAVSNQLHHPDAVTLAIFFHDVVYDATQPDNEARSADYADQQLNRLASPSSLINTVCELILDTRHQVTPTSHDGQFLVDIDLAILGQPPEAFAAYEHAIRQEYIHYPNPTYNAGRSKFLKAFLARPRLYATQHYQNLYEAAARSNLQRSIKILESL